MRPRTVRASEREWMIISQGSHSTMRIALSALRSVDNDLIIMLHSAGDIAEGSFFAAQLFARLSPCLGKNEKERERQRKRER